MSTPNPNYQDGYRRPDLETTVVPSVSYPFARNPTPDLYSKVYARTYDVLPTMYQPRIGNRTAWTNLLTYSQDLTNAAWTKTNVTPSIVAAPLAPDGNATLNQIVETVTNGEHSCSQAATAAAAQTEVSFFAAAGLGRSYIRAQFTDSAAAVFSAFFDAASCNVGATSGAVSSRIRPMGNGIFHCAFVFTPAAGAGTLKLNLSTDGSTVSYIGDTSKGMYVWGVQVATGICAPYVSTTSTTRTATAPDRELAINPNAAASDPFAFLVAESDPNVQVSTVARVSRQFARVPLTQTIPTSYLFTSPNYPAATWISGTNYLSLKTYELVGNYAVWAVLNDGTYDFTPILGYYDQLLTITGYVGTPATTITVPGHNAQPGSVIVYRRNVSGTRVMYYFTVSSVSGNDLIGTSTVMIANITGGASLAGVYTVPGFLSTSDDVCRRRTRAKLDQGATLNVPAQQIESYYLPGVTPGISTAADIPEASPYSLLSYLAAWASGAAYCNVQATQLTPWIGPVLKASYTQISMSAIP